MHPDRPSPSKQHAATLNSPALPITHKVFEEDPFTEVTEKVFSDAEDLAVSPPTPQHLTLNRVSRSPKKIPQIRAVVQKAIQERILTSEQLLIHAAKGTLTPDHLKNYESSKPSVVIWEAHRDLSGNTLLHLALENNLKGCAIWLTHRCSNLLYCENDNNENPIEHAAKIGRPETFKLLAKILSYTLPDYDHEVQALAISNLLFNVPAPENIYNELPSPLNEKCHELFINFKQFIFKYGFDFVQILPPPANTFEYLARRGGFKALTNLIQSCINYPLPTAAILLNAPTFLRHLINKILSPEAVEDLRKSVRALSPSSLPQQTKDYFHHFSFPAHNESEGGARNWENGPYLLKALVDLGHPQLAKELMALLYDKDSLDYFSTSLVVFPEIKVPQKGLFHLISRIKCREGSLPMPLKQALIEGLLSICSGKYTQLNTDDCKKIIQILPVLNHEKLYEKLIAFFIESGVLKDLISMNLIMGIIHHQIKDQNAISSAAKLVLAMMQDPTFFSSPLGPIIETYRDETLQLFHELLNTDDPRILNILVNGIIISTDTTCSPIHVALQQYMKPRIIWECKEQLHKIIITLLERGAQWNSTQHRAYLLLSGIADHFTAFDKDREWTYSELHTPLATPLMFQTATSAGLRQYCEALMKQSDPQFRELMKTSHNFITVLYHHIFRLMQQPIDDPELIPTIINLRQRMVEIDEENESNRIKSLRENYMTIFETLINKSNAAFCEDLCKLIIKDLSFQKPDITDEIQKIYILFTAPRFAIPNSAFFTCEILIKLSDVPFITKIKKPLCKEQKLVYCNKNLEKQLLPINKATFQEILNDDRSTQETVHKVKLVYQGMAFEVIFNTNKDKSGSIKIVLGEEENSGYFTKASLFKCCDSMLQRNEVSQFIKLFNEKKVLEDAIFVDHLLSPPNKINALKPVAIVITGHEKVALYTMDFNTGKLQKIKSFSCDNNGLEAIRKEYAEWKKEFDLRFQAIRAWDPAAQFIKRSSRFVVNFQTPPYRNIDCITDDPIENYQHAIKKSGILSPADLDLYDKTIQRYAQKLTKISEQCAANGGILLYDPTDRPLYEFYDQVVSIPNTPCCVAFRLPKLKSIFLVNKEGQIPLMFIAKSENDVDVARFLLLQKISEALGALQYTNNGSVLQLDQESKIAHTAPADIDWEGFMRVLHTMSQDELNNNIHAHRKPKEDLEANLKHVLKCIIKSKNLMGYEDTQKYKKEYEDIKIKLTQTYQYLSDNGQENDIKNLTVELAYDRNLCGTGIETLINLYYLSIFKLSSQDSADSLINEMKLIWQSAINETLDTLKYRTSNTMDSNQEIHLLLYIRTALTEQGFILPPDPTLPQDDPFLGQFGTEEYPEEFLQGIFLSILLPLLVIRTLDHQKELIAQNQLDRALSLNHAIVEIMSSNKTFTNKLEEQESRQNKQKELADQRKQLAACQEKLLKMKKNSKISDYEGKQRAQQEKNKQIETFAEELLKGREALKDLKRKREEHQTQASSETHDTQPKRFKWGFVEEKNIIQADEELQMEYIIARENALKALQQVEEATPADTQSDAKLLKYNALIETIETLEQSIETLSRTLAAEKNDYFDALSEEQGYTAFDEELAITVLTPKGAVLLLQNQDVLKAPIV